MSGMEGLFADLGQFDKAVEALDRAMAAVESGAQDYLLKPFDGTRLRQIVDRWFVIGSGQSESPIGR